MTALRSTLNPSVSIRLGFMQVRELAGRTVDAILKARGTAAPGCAHRPFTSFQDFLDRVRISKPEVENLILCGAFDSLGGTRPSMLWELYAGGCAAATSLRGDNPTFGKMCDDHSNEKMDWHEGLFLRRAKPSAVTGRGGPQTAPTLVCQDYTTDKKVQHELEILGMTVSEHPMFLFRDRVAPFKQRMPCAEAPHHVGRYVTVAGIVDCTRRTATADNKPMFFLTIEDETGMLEVVLFPPVYQRFGHLLGGSGVLVIKGRIESQLGAVTLAAEWLKDL